METYESKKQRILSNLGSRDLTAGIVTRAQRKQQLDADIAVFLKNGGEITVAPYIEPPKQITAAATGAYSCNYKTGNGTGSNRNNASARYRKTETHPINVSTLFDKYGK